MQYFFCMCMGFRKRDTRKDVSSIREGEKEWEVLVFGVFGFRGGGTLLCI